ncbi:MAG: SDR family oxidoreductase [Proteobacteria bacterium]|nr:SDR family oxidoreductase [Pseudomonadota bacterium]MBW3618277.1 SDR family oxidoreductase [Pseudomonadota bacterium]
MRLSPDIAAVVTGAASGLGEATARALAAQGVRVAIFDMNRERGEEVAGEIGGVFCPVDVTGDESVARGFEQARAAHGPERILVNCAGIAIGQKTVARDKQTGGIRAHDLAAFERVIRINLIGSFRCAALSAAGMMTTEPLEDGERGLIVSTASVAADEGQIGQAAYAASKGGVKAMALPMARDLMGEGIRVNTIQPGIMLTPMMAAMPQNVQDALAAAIPFPKRLGRPEEYASLVLEMARNPYLNGQSIRLDGAIRMGPR